MDDNKTIATYDSNPLLSHHAILVFQTMSANIVPKISAQDYATDTEAFATDARAFASVARAFASVACTCATFADACAIND